MSCSMSTIFVLSRWCHLRMHLITNFVFDWGRIHMQLIHRGDNDYFLSVPRWIELLWTATHQICGAHHVHIATAVVLLWLSSCNLALKSCELKTFGVFFELVIGGCGCVLFSYQAWDAYLLASQRWLTCCRPLHRHQRLPLCIGVLRVDAEHFAMFGFVFGWGCNTD